MSLNADPAATLSVKFEKVDGSKIDVQIRFMTRRDTMRHEALAAEVSNLNYGDETLWPKLRELYDIAVVSPSFDALDDLMGERDIVYLALNYPAAVQVAERELGKSKSRRLIPAAESAANAVQAIA